ncbi:hypothetical protein KKC52_12690 [bacterium]|nr:hypothetical protein [bacterium]
MESENDREEALRLMIKAHELRVAMESELIWEGRGGRVYYKDGYCSTISKAGFDEFNKTIVGAFFLIEEDISFREFEKLVKEKVKDYIEVPATEKDFYWVYLGNENYGKLNGKFYADSVFLECGLSKEEVESEKYNEWDDEEMEDAIWKLLKEFGKGKSKDELVEDGYNRDLWFKRFCVRIPKCVRISKCVRIPKCERISKMVHFTVL